MTLRLRPPRVIPTQQGFILADPYGVFQEPVVVGEGGLHLFRLMQGRTLEELQSELLKQGVLLPKEELENFLRALEGAGLLLTEGVEARLQEAEAELQRGRPVRLAGVSYPKAPEDARAFIRAFRASYAGEGKRADVVVMPHLEPARVPEVYGATLASLEVTPPPERIYLLGVAHQPLQEAAAALPVPFETPFGPAEPDLAALQALDALLPFELFNTPLAFREEHSLELPLFFLKASYPAARVLPLLIGERSPGLGEALKVLLPDYPGLVVLAVDLSHVGPRFGDRPLDPALAEEARGRDVGFLEGLIRGEAPLALGRLGHNPTRVDAVEVVATALPLLQGYKGELLSYRLDLEAATLSAVGAGTVVLHRP